MNFRRILLSLAAFVAVAPLSTWAAQESGLSKAAMAAGDPYIRALAAAGQAYSERDYAKALDKLDVADEIQANVPDTWNMRGAIYADERAFEKATDAFQKANQLNPSDFWPPYNLAELLLMEKKYGDAAKAFSKLVVYAGHDELVEFKIVFANLLGGNPDAAKPVLDTMKFPCETPAYYFAHSAWGFAHQDAKEGNYWSTEGMKVFGPERCIAFYDSLAQVGWLPMRNKDGTVPDRTELKLPEAAPDVGFPGEGN